MSTAEELKKQIDLKMKEREQLEKKILDLYEVEKVQMNGRAPGSKLVDAEGFPLSDVDVHAVTITRHDLVCSKNDLKQVQNELEKLMFALHAKLRAEQDQANAAAAAAASTETDKKEQEQQEQEQEQEEEEVPPVSNCPPIRLEEPVLYVDENASSYPPMLRVGQVLPGSAAEAAGLQTGDIICEFGKAHVGADVSLPSVVQDAAESLEGIVVKLIRNTEWTTVTLYPIMREDGRASIGCEVIPIPQN